MWYGNRTEFKTKKFCEYYVASGNAAESTIKAGYSKKTAEQIASRLLRNVKIQQYIEKLSTETRNNRIADIVEIQERLTTIIRNDDKDRIKALELLAKMQGAFNNTLQIQQIERVIIEGEDNIED